MFISQYVSDKLAIGLSVACAIHCLALPLFVSIMPAYLATTVSDESFHFWMATVVVPISVLALTLGCKKHKSILIVGLGLFGLALLIGAVILGEDYLGETLEKLLTLGGATIIAVSHLWNFRLCHASEKCECSAKPSENVQ